MVKYSCKNRWPRVSLVKILILDGQDSIGRQLWKKFIKEKHEVHIIGKKKNYDGFIKNIHEFDIEDIEFDELLKNENFNIIIDASKINLEKKAFSIKYKDIEKIVKLSKECSIDQIIVLSTTDIYIDIEHINESTKIIPKTAYSISMIAYEEYYNLYREIYLINLGVLRISNVYGDNLEYTNKELKELINSSLRDKTIVKSNLEEYKDYIFIDDMINGVYLSSLKFKTFTYNLCYGKSYCNDYILSLINVMKSDGKYYKERIKSNINISNELIKRELNWSPNTDIEDGVYSLFNCISDENKKKKKNNSRRKYLFLLLNIVLFLILSILSFNFGFDYDIHITSLIMFLLVLFSALLGLKEGIITCIFSIMFLLGNSLIFCRNRNIENTTCNICLLTNIFIYAITGILIGIFTEKAKRKAKRAESSYKNLYDKLNYIHKLYKGK